jgi:4-hydroxythreonine-4-phosphate dehydrogenase
MSRSSKSMASRHRILVTTGDVDGIGLEVSLKALGEIGPQANAQFILWRSPRTKGVSIRRFNLLKAGSLKEALSMPFDSKTIVDLVSADSPADWVEQSATGCMNDNRNALVTAPLSKTTIVKAGFKDLGHTEMLGRISGQQNLFMGFLGSKFNVVLATGHKPLGQAVQAWQPETLQRAMAAANELRSILPARRRKLAIGLVGLNPHAGESGLIGEEELWMAKVARSTDKSILVEGPLVPDSAFLPHMWKKFSVYVSPYHDQGLIPFKLVHGFSQGVHLTLGLPFVRTSVDHGTAKDLFGRNKADSGSMTEALQTAIKLVKERFK